MYFRFCVQNQNQFYEFVFKFFFRVDEFSLESPALGQIQRVRIGHDNRGPAPGWFLDKVIVDDMDNNVVAEFPCMRWFSKSEDDGAVSRDLLRSTGPMNAPPGLYDI